MVEISPELKAAVACCRWPPSADRDRRIRQAVADVDWLLFAKIIARHRVEALVFAALTGANVAIPSDVAARLSNAAAATARQNLELAAASVRLSRAFAAAGIPLLFVKGVTLGQLAYGDIALKMGWDIDILVPPERLGDAAALLQAQGFALHLPVLPSGKSQLGEWHELSKESIWRDGRGHHVELHTRLADNPALIPTIDCRAPIQLVTVVGHPLATLRLEELFAYLCVHGAASLWFRLKWIADLAALIAPLAADEVERLYRSAGELGAGRSAAQALLLGRALFDIAMPAALIAEMERDRVARWLSAAALRQIAGRTAAVELDAVRLGTAAIHLSQLGLLPGIGFKRSEIVRQARFSPALVGVRLWRPLRPLSLVAYLAVRGAAKFRRSAISRGSG